MALRPPGPLESYNSLTDEYLMDYFNNRKIRKHLRNMGLITKKGEVVDEPTFRYNAARKDHRSHVKDLMSQAVINKTLELERNRRAFIRDKLVEIRKVETVHRIKRERDHRDDHPMDIIDKNGRPKSAPSKLKSQDVEGINIPAGSKVKWVPLIVPPSGSTPYLALSGSYGVPTSPEPPKVTPVPKRRVQSATCRPKPNHIDEVSCQDAPRNQSCRRKKGTARCVLVNNFTDPQFTSPDHHQSTIACAPRPNSQVIRAYTSTPHLEKWEREGGTAFIKKEIKLKAKPLLHQRDRPKSAKNKTPPKQRPQSAQPPRTQHNSQFLQRRQIHSMSRITLKYLGRSLDLSPGVFGDSVEVLIMQQHCGGNTVCVFQGLVSPNECFTFTSRRHRDAPFGITIYISAMQDTRLSTCCEYRHKAGHILGGKSGHFALVKVEGCMPCYKCFAHTDEFKKQQEEAHIKFQNDARGHYEAQGHNLTEAHARFSNEARGQHEPTKPKKKKKKVVKKKHSSASSEDEKPHLGAKVTVKPKAEPSADDMRQFEKMVQAQEADEVDELVLNDTDEEEDKPPPVQQNSIKEESSEDEGTLKETENEKGVGDEPAEEPVHQSSAPIVKPASQPVRRPTEPATVVSPVVEKEEEKVVEPVPAVKEKREEVVEKEDEYEDFFEEDKSDEVLVGEKKKEEKVVAVELPTAPVVVAVVEEPVVQPVVAAPTAPEIKEKEAVTNGYTEEKFESEDDKSDVSSIKSDKSDKSNKSDSTSSIKSEGSNKDKDDSSVSSIKSENSMVVHQDQAKEVKDDTDIEEESVKEEDRTLTPTNPKDLRGSISSTTTPTSTIISPPSSVHGSSPPSTLPSSTPVSPHSSSSNITPPPSVSPSSSLDYVNPPSRMSKPSESIPTYSEDFTSSVSGGDSLTSIKRIISQRSTTSELFKPNSPRLEVNSSSNTTSSGSSSNLKVKSSRFTSVVSKLKQSFRSLPKSSTASRASSFAIFPVETSSDYTEGTIQTEIEGGVSMENTTIDSSKLENGVSYHTSKKSKTGSERSSTTQVQHNCPSEHTDSKQSSAGSVAKTSPDSAEKSSAQLLPKDSGTMPSRISTSSLSNKPLRSHSSHSSKHSSSGEISAFSQSTISAMEKVLSDRLAADSTKALDQAVIQNGELSRAPSSKEDGKASPLGLLIKTKVAPGVVSFVEDLLQESQRRVSIVPDLIEEEHLDHKVEVSLKVPGHDRTHRTSVSHNSQSNISSENSWFAFSHHSIDSEASEVKTKVAPGVVSFVEDLLQESQRRFSTVPDLIEEEHLEDHKVEVPSKVPGHNRTHRESVPHNSQTNMSSENSWFAFSHHSIASEASEAVTSMSSDERLISSRPEATSKQVAQSPVPISSKTTAQISDITNEGFVAETPTPLPSEDESDDESDNSWFNEAGSDNESELSYHSNSSNISDTSTTNASTSQLKAVSGMLSPTQSILSVDSDRKKDPNRHIRFAETVTQKVASDDDYSDG